MSKSLKRLWKISVVVVAAFFLLVLSFYLVQERFIFQGNELPAHYRFHFEQPFKESTITTPDGESLNALLFKTTSPSRGLIIYFHGNRGTLQRWGSYAADFTSLGYDVLMCDYRGYGKSTGKPTEDNLYQDAETILAWALDSLEFQRLVFYGRSLGSAMASHLAAVYPPDLLILETPFDDIHGAVFPPLRFVLSHLPPRYLFSNKESMARVKCRKVIIHGTDDWVVPISSAERLRPYLLPSDRFVVIPDGGHGNLREFSQYHETLRTVLE